LGPSCFFIPALVNQSPVRPKFLRQTKDLLVLHPHVLVEKSDDFIFRFVQIGGVRSEDPLGQMQSSMNMSPLQMTSLLSLRMGNSSISRERNSQKGLVLPASMLPMAALLKSMYLPQL
jgi:hypothetical protein